MAAYEQVEEFEPIPEEKEGEVLSARPADGMPQDSDDRLDFTQNVRALIVNEIIKGGQVPVNDKDRMSILKDALDGIDRQELGKKKISAKKEETAANINNVAKMLERFSMEVSRSTNGAPMEKMLAEKPKRDPSVFNRDVRAQFPDINESELELTRREESSEEFFERMKEDE